LYKSFYLIFSLNIFLITIESINRAKNPINGIYISEDNNKSTKLGTFSLLLIIFYKPLPSETSTNKDGISPIKVPIK